MIRINRTKHDQSEQEILPSDIWFERARTATEEAINEKDQHKFRDEVYGATEVRVRLIELSHDKCAIASTRSLAQILTLNTTAPKEGCMSQNAIWAITGWHTTGTISCRHANTVTSRGENSRHRGAPAGQEQKVKGTNSHYGMKHNELSPQPM